MRRGASCLDRKTHIQDSWVCGKPDELMTTPLYEDLSEMRSLIKELHGGWLHLVSPIRGASLEEPKVEGNDAFGSLGY